MSTTTTGNNIKDDIKGNICDRKGPVGMNTFDVWTSYVRKHPYIAGVIVVLTLTYPIEAVLNPFLFARFITAIEKKDQKGMLNNLIYLAIVNVLAMVGYNIDQVVSEDLSITMQSHVAQHVMTYLFCTKKYSVETLRNGEVITKIKKYAFAVSHYINLLRNNVIPDLMALFTQSVYLLSIDKGLAAIVFAMMLVILAMLLIAIQTCGVPCENSTEAEANLYEQVDDQLLNFGTIVNHDGYKRELRRLDVLGIKARELRRRAVECSLIYSSIMNAAVIGLAGIYARRLYKKFIMNPNGVSKNLGQATAAVTILFEAFNISKSVFYHLHDIAYTNAILERCVKTFHELAEQNPNATATGTSTGTATTTATGTGTAASSMNRTNSPALEARDLVFTYKDKETPVINGLSVKFPVGSKTAIQGPNGTGKSTLLKIFMRYIPRSSGQLLFKGDLIEDVNSEDMRQKMGYVPQHAVLFDRTLAENMLYGNSNITRQQLETKIKQFQLEAFFKQFDKGIDSMAGKQGSHLSGGQRQIVQLVRVLLQDPSVILLDEPTAGVDEQYKELVIRLLQQLFKNKTVLLVSHDKLLLQSMTEIIDLGELKKKQS